jgi:hypothetical protein
VDQRFEVTRQFNGRRGRVAGISGGRESGRAQDGAAVFRRQSNSVPYAGSCFVLSGQRGWLRGGGAGKKSAYRPKARRAAFNAGPVSVRRQVENLRYDRLKICATPRRGARKVMAG